MDKEENKPENIVEKRMDIQQVLNAARNLTDAQREVISLRFTAGMPTAQVAEIMGKNPGAIKALQHSAIAALRKSLLAEYND